LDGIRFEKWKKTVQKKRDGYSPNDLSGAGAKTMAQEEGVGSGKRRGKGKSGEREFSY